MEEKDLKTDGIASNSVAFASENISLDKHPNTETVGEFHTPRANTAENQTKKQKKWTKTKCAQLATESVRQNN